MRLARVRSSPGVCGPRSSSSHTIASSCALSLSVPYSVLQKRCWYFGTRLPKPDFSITKCFLASWSRVS